VVDFHAEATSEKIALARVLDGRVTAVIGTHTHVQTNDARVQPGGTAAITDGDYGSGSQGVRPPASQLVTTWSPNLNP
jgi:2',3'-cyclic-nucleotide 2'-phosphodiesterase